MKKLYIFSLFSILLIQACGSSESAQVESTSATGQTSQSCKIKQLSDFPEQMDCLKKNANAGIALDQYNLAVALRDGLNHGNIDLNESFYWMKKRQNKECLPPN